MGAKKQKDVLKAAHTPNFKKHRYFSTVSDSDNTEESNKVAKNNVDSGFPPKGKRKYDSYRMNESNPFNKRDNRTSTKKKRYDDGGSRDPHEMTKFSKNEMENNIDCEYATTLINSIKADKSEEKELKMRALTSWFEGKLEPLMFSKSGSFACKEFLGLLDTKQFVEHLILLWEVDMASLVSHCHSSFVMKAILERLIVLLPENSKDKELCGSIKKWVKKFHEFTQEHLEEFLSDEIAIFVLEAFLRVLGGLTKIFPKKGKKNHGEAELKWSWVPKTFIKLLRLITESILEKVNLEEWLEDSNRIIVLLSLLDIIHHRLPDHCQTIVQHYHQIFVPSDNRFLLMSKNGSLLGEKLWLLASEEQQKDLFTSHLQAHISALAQDNFANFFIQKALEFSHSEEVFKAFSKELYPYFGNFLTSTSGANILLAMARGCLKHTSSQKKFTKHLRESLQCMKMPIMFLPLVMRLIPLEKYTEDQEHEISLVGALLAQTLFTFEKNSTLVESLLKLDALKLACNKQGSFILEAFLSSPTVDEGSKKTVLSSLKPHVAELLKNQPGSRIFDVLWEQLGSKDREFLLQNIIAEEPTLQDNPNWKFVKLKVGLNLFKFNKLKWFKIFGGK